MITVPINERTAELVISAIEFRLAPPSERGLLLCKPFTVDDYYRLEKLADRIRDLLLEQ